MWVTGVYDLYYQISIYRLVREVWEVGNYIYLSTLSFARRGCSDSLAPDAVTHRPWMLGLMGRGCRDSWADTNNTSEIFCQLIFKIMALVDNCYLC